MDIIIPILGTIVSVAIVIFVGIPAILEYSRKWKSALEKLKNELGLTIPKFSFAYQTLEGSLEGNKISLVLIPAQKHSPAHLKIILFKTTIFSLKIYKESLSSSIGKKIGLVREIKTNDEAFDKSFLIFSKHKIQALNYLSNDAVRNNIKELFVLGFESLEISGKRIVIVRPYNGRNVENELEPGKIKDALARLAILAKNCY